MARPKSTAPRKKMAAHNQGNKGGYPCIRYGAARYQVKRYGLTGTLIADLVLQIFAYVA